MDQMKATIRLVGQAIRAGSKHLPTRNLAASLATLAPPKDYLAQAHSIYNGFLKRWRYVKDPLTREMVTASPDASFRLVMAGDGVGVGNGLGAGDCDCATIALGSLYESVGFPVRLATVAKPMAPPGRLMDHIYPEVKIPKIGWVPADPVLHPKKGFGDTPPASRKVVYDLLGDIIEYGGNLGNIAHKGATQMTIPQTWNRPPWRTYGEDYSDRFFGAENDGIPLQPWESVGLAGYGYLVPQMGDMETEIPVEVGDDQTVFYNGLARTPMVELSPEDYQYMETNRGVPYEGMLGLGDDGETYVYDGLGGFFKRLFRKIKKKVKKVGRRIRRGIRRVRKGIRRVGRKAFSVVRKVGKRIRRGIRRVVKRLPGGKALIKIAGKIRKVAMKVVRPVTKFVGKYASKIAPIARFIPGYGPAISAGLRIAGRVARGIQTARRISRGRVPRRMMRGRIPGLFGESTPESIEAQEDLAPYIDRYVH